MRVLLTGASGFVGPAILEALIRQGHQPIVAARSPLALPQLPEFRDCPDFRTLTAGAADRLLDGVEGIIHAAGHAHADADSDPTIHEAVNARAPGIIAEAASKRGQRMVFLSSIKALGHTDTHGFLHEDQEPRPDDAYGRAKLEAERAIRAHLPGGHVILRPALVAGPGAKGNLAALLRLARLPLPLPLAGIDAPRSLVSRDDLAEIAVRALQEPDWIGRTLIVADPDPLTAGGMIAAMRRGMGRGPGLFSLPDGWSETLVRRAFGAEKAARLFTPLMAVPSFLRAAGWRPQVPASAALEAMGRQAVRPV